MTFWHYTDNENLEGLGLLPGNSATDNPNLSAESARALLEVESPTVVYPVTVDPDDPEYPLLDNGNVPAGGHGLGGGQDWYFPNGTPPGSIGPPRPVFNRNSSQLDDKI